MASAALTWVVRLRPRRAARPALRVALAALAYVAGAFPALGQGTPEEWRTAQRPSLVIGSANGDEATLFQSVLDVKALQGGGVAVADDGMLSVRVFDRRGQLAAEMGGEGSGPGEFRSIYGLWLTSSGDIGVWDPAGPLISTFSVDGALLTSRRLSGGPAVGNTEVFFGTTSDDEVILGSLAPVTERRGELVPNPWLLYTFRLSGEFVRQIGHVRGMWRYNRNPSPFSPVPWIGLSQDSLFVSDGFEPRVGVRTLDGPEVRKIDVGSAVEATRQDWDELRDSLKAREGSSAVHGFFLQLIDQGVMPFQSRLPAYAGMLIDDVGVLWLKKYEAPRDAIWLRTHSTRTAPGGVWMAVRTSDGAVLSEVTMPADFTPMDIREDRIVGVAVDTWGVQRVVVYPLSRASTGR